MTSLADLVGDVETFGRTTWGRRARHWQRCQGDPAPFGVGDLDRLLTSAVRTPAVRLVRHGQRVEPDRYCSPTRIGNATLGDVVDPRKVIDEYRRGATVVLQALHRTWSPLSAWCADLEAELGWPVHCNAYLTPPGTAGLARHADGHDVFAVQLFGAKHWDVDGLGDVELSEHDVLYMPAGVRHDAETRDAASLHLTVGVHRPTAARIARTALAVATAAADVDAATGSPVPAGRGADLDGAIDVAASAAWRALGTVDADAVAARLRRPARQHLGGIVEMAVSRPAIDADTVVEVRPDLELHVSIEPRREPPVVRVDWSTGSLSMPAIVDDAMHMIADAGRSGHAFRVGDLRGLDDDDRVVLVRRLVDEGVVVVTTRR